MDILNRDAAIERAEEMWMPCDKAAGGSGKQTGWLIGEQIGDRKGCHGEGQEEDVEGRCLSCVQRGREEKCEGNG